MRGRVFSALVVSAALTVAGCASRPEAATDSDATAPAASSGGAPRADLSADFAAAAGERVFFEYDQADLSNDAREVLRRQAQWLQRNPGVSVMIAGNCDERGTREYNLALGARRAAAAREFLIGLGVEGRRIQTTSFGKDRPVDARANAEGWAVNRNAHTQVVSGAAS